MKKRRNDLRVPTDTRDAWGQQGTCTQTFKWGQHCPNVWSTPSSVCI